MTAAEIRESAKNVEWQRCQGVSGRTGPGEWLAAGTRALHEAMGASMVSLRGGLAADGLPGGLLPSMGGWGAGGEVEFCKLWGMLEFLACLPETASTPEDRYWVSGVGG